MIKHNSQLTGYIRILRRTTAAALVLMLLFGVCAVCAPLDVLRAEAEDYVSTKDDFYATIRTPGDNDKFISDHDGSPVLVTNGIPLDQEKINRLWRIKKQQDGKYLIYAGQENKVLTFQDNTVLLQDPVAGNNAQKWVIELAESDKVLLKANGTDKYADYTDGTLKMAQKANDTAKQEFTIGTDSLYSDFPDTPVPNVNPGSTTKATSVIWQPVDNATSYNIYITQNDAPARTVYDTTGEECDGGLQCDIMLPAGTYTAKVEAVNGKLYDCSAVSEPTAAFTVAEGSDTVPPKSTLTVTPGTPTTNTAFSWTESTGADKYELYIETLDGSGNHVKTEKMPDQTGTSYNKVLPAGSYKAWLNAVKSSVPNWSESDPVTFTVAGPVTHDPENDLPDDFFGFISSKPSYDTVTQEYDKNVYNQNGAVVLTTNDPGNDYGSPKMIWHFVKQGNGNYTIVSGVPSSEGKALTSKSVSGSLTNDVVLENAETPSTLQYWEITGTDGVYKLSVMGSNLFLDVHDNDLLMDLNDDNDENQKFFICTNLTPSPVPAKTTLTVTPGKSNTDTTFNWTDVGDVSTMFLLYIIPLDESGNEKEGNPAPYLIYRNATPDQTTPTTEYKTKLTEGKYKAYIEALNEKVYGAKSVSDPVTFDVAKDIPAENPDGTRTYTFDCSFAGASGTGKTPVTAKIKKGSNVVSTKTAPYSSADGGAKLTADLEDGQDYTIEFTKPGHTSYTANIKSGTDGNPGKIYLYPGDITGDGAINAHDQAAMTDIFGVKSTDSKYNIAADFNEDGTINAADRSEIVKNFGKTKTPAP